MAKLTARVRRMEESKLNNNAMVNTLLITFLGADQGHPVEYKHHGWSYTRNGAMQKVLRMEGETDEQLEKRSIGLAREGEPECKVIMLFQMVTAEA